MNLQLLNGEIDDEKVRRHQAFVDSFRDLGQKIDVFESRAKTAVEKNYQLSKLTSDRPPFYDYARAMHPIHTARAQRTHALFDRFGVPESIVYTIERELKS